LDTVFLNLNNNMNNLSHQIYKFRVLYLSGWAAMIFTVFYAINYNEWVLFLLSFVWGRIVSLFSIIIGLHRYYAHKSFETGNLRKKFLLYFSILGAEGSPLAWGVHHRHHHRYADTERDIHSPYESIILSSFIWQIKKPSWWLKTKEVKTLPKDLMRDKDILFVDKYYYHIWILLSLTTLLIDWKLFVFFLLAPAGWAYFFGIMINTLSHINMPGSYRSFDTTDCSYNNKVLAIITLGEGLHNNHHGKTTLSNFAIRRGEFDLAGLIIDKFFKVQS